MTGGVSAIRRYAAMILDNVGITFFMAMMGEDGAWMFGLYLFIIFGNGFRYGPLYLHICQAMSFIGFGAVMYFDDQLVEQPQHRLCLFVRDISFSLSM